MHLGAKADSKNEDFSSVSPLKCSMYVHMSVQVSVGEDTRELVPPSSRGDDAVCLSQTKRDPALGLSEREAIFVLFPSIDRGNFLCCFLQLQQKFGGGMVPRRVVVGRSCLEPPRQLHIAHTDLP